jgi:hypothetical protein
MVVLGDEATADELLVEKDGLPVPGVDGDLRRHARRPESPAPVGGEIPPERPYQLRRELRTVRRPVG